MCSYDHHFSLGAKSGHICHSGGIREVAWSLIPFIIKDEKVANGACREESFY
jgi:hypothetical protein